MAQIYSSIVVLISNPYLIRHLKDLKFVRYSASSTNPARDIGIFSFNHISKGKYWYFSTIL